MWWIGSGLLRRFTPRNDGEDAKKPAGAGFWFGLGSVQTMI